MIEEEIEYSFDFWVEPQEREFIRKEFKIVFETFIKHNYPSDNDSLMCSIHDSFEEEGHNCVACNLEKSSKLIANYLRGYKSFESSESVFTSFIWHLYMMTVRMEEYIDIMCITEGIKYKKFGIFPKIKRWANFIKHPKAFMFVHHPCYSFESTPVPPGCDILRHEITIDDEFIKKFYSGGKNNAKLKDELTNKEGVMVQFPDPVKLMEEFVIAQKNFVEIISDNKMVRELLDEKATKYYELEDEELKENKL